MEYAKPIIGYSRVQAVFGFAALILSFRAVYHGLIPLVVGAFFDDSINHHYIQSLQKTVSLKFETMAPKSAPACLLIKHSVVTQCDNT